MKKDIMNILCCPACKGDLSISITEERDGDIIRGTLTCSSCGKKYLINDGIADMLIKNNEDTS